MPTPVPDPIPPTNVAYAGVAIAGKNLNVKKGDRLPDRWQTAPQIRWLRDRYGFAAVVVQQERTVGRKDEALAAPERAKVARTR